MGMREVIMATRDELVEVRLDRAIAPNSVRPRGTRTTSR